mmetsp:Transcript_15902/g.24512  ORF Transcript_15902/g.24512 Transcript_15902/m.24512 type:complete len:157 (+) Transcript_15902:1206-1676(+)
MLKQKEKKRKSSNRRSTSPMSSNRGINKPPKPFQQSETTAHNLSVNNSYMKNLFQQDLQSEGSLLNESSRTIEQQSLNFSVQSGFGGEPESSCCNPMQAVNKMKKFHLSSAKAVREFFIKKGIRLFVDLNENLNGYKQSFEREQVLSGDEIKHGIT